MNISQQESSLLFLHPSELNTRLMNKNHEKAMLDLQNLIKDQNFNSIDDAKKFMSQFTGKAIPSKKDKYVTAEERAQELVYEASETENVIEADKKVFLALVNDADCVEAYEYMAGSARSALQSMIFFKNGITAARKKLGEKFFEESKGYFWGIHETRPYMRCMLGYAMGLYALDQKDVAFNTLKQMLELNSNDNQGARDYAMIYALELGKLDEYEKLYEQFKTDITAFATFNYALFLFLKDGDNAVSRAALEVARGRNNNVMAMLMSKKDLPENPKSYSLGDKNEAIYYCDFARHVWQQSEGAIAWLTNVYQKR